MGGLEMNPSNKISQEEYKRELNRIHSGGPASTIRPNHSKTKVRRQAISAVPGLFGTGPMGLHAGPFAIEVTIHGPCRADIDNIAKGILDALNGTAYVDDKQCVELIVRRQSQDSF
jgi:Holliday junction resolvase RusA-like endonuclease